jgi:hypothetical protein
MASKVQMAISIIMLILVLLAFRWIACDMWHTEVIPIIKKKTPIKHEAYKKLSTKSI